MEVWPGRPIKRASPRFATDAHVWLGEVMTVSPDGQVDEFTLRPDAPMLLSQYLEVIQHEIHRLVPDHAGDCGFRVYARY